MQIFLLFRSTIGQKILMALSGLLYIGFLVAHLSGNFLLYKGRDAFNSFMDNNKKKIAKGKDYKAQSLKGQKQTNSRYMAFSRIPKISKPK